MNFSANQADDNQEKGMKKAAAAVLVLFLTLSAFVSCGEANTGAGDTTPALTNPPEISADATADPSETERIQPDVGSADFDGHVFRVLTRGTSSSTWYSRDIYAEGITGDVISDAVYTRNVHMEDKYGFIVEEVGSSKPADDAVTAVTSGDDIYDMFCFKIKDDITSLLLKGYLRNLNNVEKMNLDKPYYDQNSRKAFSLVNKLYLITGDLLTMDNDATRCCLFNKATFGDLQLSGKIGGTLYELMSDGKWTLDVLSECAAVATSDENGDGVMDINDKFGMVSEQFNVLAFYNAAGRLMFEKNADDIPVFTANSEDSLDVFSKIVTLLCGDYCRHYSNAYNEAIPQFSEGLILFYPAQLADVPLQREMEYDFGIIPLPKLDENQDGYHSPVTTYGSNCISIPTSVQDVDRAAVIIEVLSCESMYEVTPAYFELNLKSRLARDAESSPSIDIILKTACFELGYMWNYGSVYSAITNAFNNANPNLATPFKQVEKSAGKTIEKNMETIRSFTA